MAGCGAQPAATNPAKPAASSAACSRPRLQMRPEHIARIPHPHLNPAGSGPVHTAAGA
jgi:hypothetical protein